MSLLEGLQKTKYSRADISLPKGSYENDFCRNSDIALFFRGNACDVTDNGDGNFTVTTSNGNGKLNVRGVHYLESDTEFRGGEIEFS